ncbi:MAG TPA: SUMF1/EgtB/PvdO family nonheme iron enzyme [Thermoanaerobaculia bacterium]|jgi:formylglycine-generating enzyme required for sulfatase activity|nr:SUMF1/EgtB/PvdO family nonheme iron enzyme [Thermoanaerobaculia bacterium]
MVPANVTIEAGWFVMGSVDGPDNERPAHRVWVDAFELAAWQTTNSEYAAFLAATGHPPPPLWNDPAFSDPRQPVVAVSWFDAVAYCDWLGGKHRLPTEAEWEHAARGGAEGLSYPWGNTPRDDDARRSSAPARVAQGAPNAFGLYDMCENVHEWCADWYSASYYATSPAHNPPGAPTGTRRVSRGGSWRHAVKVTRCAARSSIPPDFRYADYGFRPARPAAPLGQALGMPVA